MQGYPLTPDQKVKFIKKLKSSNGNVSKACQAIAISRQTIYEHRKNDADFAQLWDETIESIVDEMEAECYRRAVKGVVKPVYQQGRKVGSIREFSDSLLQFALKGKRPEIYRDKMDLNANIKGNIDLTLYDKMKKFYGKPDPDSTK